MKGWTTPPTRAQDYFDYDYAKRAWFTFKSYDALEKEYEKYKAVFRLWFDKNDVAMRMSRAATLKALESHPDKETIKRGHDLQLVYDHWLDEVYGDWVLDYLNGETTLSFEDLVSTSQDSAKECWPENSFPTWKLCGYVPDWRSIKRKAANAAMYEKVPQNRRRKEQTARDMQRILKDADPEGALQRYIKEQHDR